MDPEGFFKEPVDEEQAEAPGYYDSIANPMDFSTIQSELMCSHNISWRNFMEVFELVCLNALLYNRKGSRIHKSAQQLLRNGRRFLQGKELEGRRAMTTCTCYAPGTEASKAVSILTKLGPGSAYLKQEEKDLSSLEKNVRADEEIAHDNSAWPLRISHPDAEDVEVESASDAASESSSSFGSAGSDPGEGEHDADQPSCESLPTSREFQRLPIGAEWKRYRRGVEWRCRWLELREQDLQRQLQAYDVLEAKLLAQQASKLAHVDMKASLDALDEGSSEGRKAPPVDTPTSLRIKDLDQPENSASTSRSDAEGTVGARKCVNKASLRGDQNQEPPTVGTSARSSLAFTGQGQTTKVHHRRHRKRSRCQSAYKSRKSALKKQEVPWARSGKPVNQAVTLDSGHLLELSCHPVLSRLYKSRATPSARRKRVAAEGRENMGEAEAKEAARVEEQETAAAEKLTLMQQVALAVVAVDDLSSSDSEVSTMALFEQMQDLQRKVGLLREKLGAHMGERLASRTPLSTIGRAGSGFGQSRQRKISTSSMPSSPCRSSGAGAVSTKKDASNRHQQAAAAYLKRKVTPQEEFDLNNIVGGNMGGAGPRFVERAPHMLINTPKVRDLEAGDSIRVVSRSMEGGSMCSEGDGEKAASSDEDTSDEAYLARHAPLELMERSRNTYAVSGRGKRGQKKKRDSSYHPGSNGGKYGGGKMGRKGSCVGRPPLNSAGESSGKMGRHTSHSSHGSISLLSRENSGSGAIFNSEDISVAPVIKMEDAEMLIEQSMAEAEAVERRAASDAAAARAQAEAAEASEYHAGRQGGVGIVGLAHMRTDQPHIGMVQLPGMLPMQMPGLGVDAMSRGMPGGDTMMFQHMSTVGTPLQLTSGGLGAEGVHHQQQYLQASSANGDHRDLIAAADSLFPDMDELMEEAMHDERAASQSAAADRLGAGHPSTSIGDYTLPIPQDPSSFQIPCVTTTGTHDTVVHSEMIPVQLTATGTQIDAANSDSSMHDMSWKVSAPNPTVGGSGSLKIVLKRASKTG